MNSMSPTTSTAIATATSTIVTTRQCPYSFSRPGGMRGAIRRPTAGGAACWTPNQSLGQFYQAKSVIIKSPSLDLVLPPLYLSPGPRTFRRVGAKMTALSSLLVIFSIFWPSKKSFKICFEKITKKMRKSRFLASQNLPKILPKRLRNRCPKKHAIFHRFFLEKAFVARAPTSISYWFFQYFLLVGHFSSNRFWHAFWLRKTYQKPFQNDVRTL